MSPHRRGRFIVFEGVEGAGKSTQMRRVANVLVGTGLEPVVTREPGGTAVGEAIREIVLDPASSIGPRAEVLLILAARATFVDAIVRPALDADRVVLSDRYDLSTFAYQGGGRGLPLAHLRELNDFATGGLRPDLYLVLDVDPERGLERSRREGGDRIESEDSDFHRRVAESYRELARTEPDVVLVDAAGGIDEVFHGVWEALSGRFPETFPPDAG